jgi:poly(3-hydroxybutyrate) depolymerase
VLEKVACKDDPSQTYALYLPSGLDGNQKWPVLLCFDPGARGKAPVERFQAAAEKFGWVIAGSNNSRNGPWTANATAINAMVKDLTRHLPLDLKRVYAAGLSGGARVACQIAMGGMAQGVIACSAAFPGSETPSKVPFAFFGTAGLTDFNYRELRRVDRELADKRAVHRVVIFDGGHEWLPSALAVEAIAWLELQAMRTGTKPKDQAWIQEQFAARVATAPLKPLLDRQSGLKTIAADFKGLADTTAVERELAEISATRELRDAVKAERTRERAEEMTMESLLSAANEGIGASIRKTVTDLQAKAQSAGPDRATAIRVLQGVASTCSEGAREAMRNHEYEHAATLLEMVVLLRPERPQGHFELARARAQLGDKKRAVLALQQAIAAGFTDATRVRDEKAFDKLRSDSAFLSAIGGLK